MVPSRIFPSADLLVRAGCAVQEAAVGRGVDLRAGVATGDVVREAGDCFGEAVWWPADCLAGGAAASFWCRRPPQRSGAPAEIHR